MAYVINTTNINIDWDDQAETRFDQLTVISKDDFPIQVAVKVVIRVRPDQAPYMVAKVGSIDNLIQHVLHPTIDSSFRNQASTASAMNFLQSRSEEQEKAESRARIDLEKYHVECVSRNRRTLRFRCRKDVDCCFLNRSNIGGHTQSNVIYSSGTDRFSACTHPRQIRSCGFGVEDLPVKRRSHLSQSPQRSNSSGAAIFPVIFNV
jgi:hypothetical protein